MPSWGSIDYGKSSVSKPGPRADPDPAVVRTASLKEVGSGFDRRGVYGSLTARASHTDNAAHPLLRRC
jgi:hypothetical protein